MIKLITLARRYLCQLSSINGRRAVVSSEHSAHMMLLSLQDGKQTLFKVSFRIRVPLSTGLAAIELYYNRMRSVKAKGQRATVTLLNGSSLDAVDLETINRDAWVSGHILSIADLRFVVQVNPPRVVELRLPRTNLLIGFTIAPYVRMQYGRVNASKYEWYTGSTQSGAIAWNKVGDALTYKIKQTDYGRRLKVRCTPCYDDVSGDPVEKVSLLPVSRGPGEYLFQKRHQYTQAKLHQLGDCRIVSYNILSRAYDTSSFSYCESEALDPSYRLALIVEELVGYNADIICLQECDNQTFEEVLAPALRSYGFAGHYISKKLKFKEGEAIFYDRKKFQFVSLHNIHLRDALAKNKNQAPLLAQVRRHPALLRLCQKFWNVAATCVLRWRDAPGRLICVCNTHLYSNPDHPEVRLVQTAIILNHLSMIRNKYEVINEKLPIVLCGDFNSSPDSAVYQLLTTNAIEESHPIWQQGYLQKGYSEFSLVNDLNFYSLCGIPQFTNYVNTFKGTIDYIFGEKDYVTVNKVIPLPSEEEIKRHTALPSITSPSDHLALVCDVTINNSKA